MGCEIPLVLEPAASIWCFKAGDGHDEVVDKLDGNIEEPSVCVGVPFLEDDEVLFARLDVVRIEYDFTEVDVGDKHFALQSCVPHVVGVVDHRGVHMELDKRSESSPYP